MSTESKLAGQKASDEEPGFSAEDLAKIFNYPSIGQLFTESNASAFEDFRSRLISTRDNLEKVVRLGSRDEADKARTAVNGISVTLDFLQSLHQMRISR